jgi:hypothetical protein
VVEEDELQAVLDDDRVLGEEVRSGLVVPRSSAAVQARTTAAGPRRRFAPTDAAPSTRAAVTTSATAVGRLVTRGIVR